MCPLEQRASAPSKPAWTPEVVDGRVASSPARTFGIVRVPTATDFAREDASELYRMTWGWEPRCSYEVDPDDENPFPLYGNWATPDGKCFFCEWYDDCPPCEDSIRGPRMPGGGSWQEQDADGFGLGHPDADDFVHY